MLFFLWISIISCTIYKVSALSPGPTPLDNPDPNDYPGYYYQGKYYYYTGENGSVRIKQEKYPEIFLNGKWVPICGHYFWDTNYGADLFCQKLDPKFTSGIVSKSHGKRLASDGVRIGKCQQGDQRLKSCTGGCNDFGIGNELFGCANCEAGQLAAVEIQCFTGQKDDCQTVEGKKCVFPFVYNGNTYDSCTIDESVNGLAWCATGVDRNRKAEAWEDCRPGCPGHGGKKNFDLVSEEDYEEIWPLIDLEDSGSVRLVEEKFPEVFWNGVWTPICGHWFWNNDYGADLFCQKLDPKYVSGTVIKRRDVKLRQNGIQIGECKINDNSLLACTGGCNDLKTGNGHCAKCGIGQKAAINIKCHESRLVAKFFLIAYQQTCQELHDDTICNGDILRFSPFGPEISENLKK